MRRLLRLLRRRCRLCGEPLPEERSNPRGRGFCSASHQQAYHAERELKRLAGSRLMQDLLRRGRGGCC